MSKLKQVFNWIEQLQAKIIFLQEGHVVASDIIKVRKRWPGQVFFPSYSSQAGEVLTLIHKSIPLQIYNVIKDSGGRFLLAQGILLNEKLNLINVYGPNNDDPKFFNNLFLTDLPDKHIISGDFNCTLDPIKDCSSDIDYSHFNTRKIIIHQYIQELDRTDIWRFLHPTSWSYSCHSSTHLTYSCIDYFQISSQRISKIEDCQYNDFVISDHAAVSLVYSDSKLMSNHPKWRFQQRWLLDPTFTEFLDKQIDFFYETPAAIRWDSFMAYIRGQISIETSTEQLIIKWNLSNFKLKTWKKTYSKISAKTQKHSRNCFYSEHNLMKYQQVKLLQVMLWPRGEAQETVSMAYKATESERAISYVEDDKGNALLLLLNL